MLYLYEQSNPPTPQYNSIRASDIPPYTMRTVKDRRERKKRTPILNLRDKDCHYKRQRHPQEITEPDLQSERFLCIGRPQQISWQFECNIFLIPVGLNRTSTGCHSLKRRPTKGWTPATVICSWHRHIALGPWSDSSINPDLRAELWRKALPRCFTSD